MADVEQFDSGAFVSEIRKQEAQAVDRVRTALDEQWKAASAVGALVFAVGLTGLTELPVVVRVLAAIAVVLWLAAVMSFLRAKSGGTPDELSAAQQQFESRYRLPASPTPLQRRDREAKVALKAAQKVLQDKQRSAMYWVYAAVVATGVAMIASAIDFDDTDIRGVLLLTADGRSTIAEACPAVGSPEEAEGIVASTDENLIGGDDEIWLRFAKGACDDVRMRVVVDADLVLGVAGP